MKNHYLRYYDGKHVITYCGLIFKSWKSWKNAITNKDKLGHPHYDKVCKNCKRTLERALDNQ